MRDKCERCLTGTARYENKLKVYEVDRCNVYHLLPTVTERYFKPGALSMIMVSLAANIMSGSVTAAINALVTVGKDNNVVSFIDTVGKLSCLHNLKIPISQSVQTFISSTVRSPITCVPPLSHF